jgi:hypothetical protein
VLQQRGGVIGELLVGERAVDVGGVPMALELDRDDPVALASAGTRSPISSTVMYAPANTTSGSPAPWIS